MGLKQQPKCKDKTCQFCTGKYCTILKQKPEGECPFRKVRKSSAKKAKERYQWIKENHLCVQCHKQDAYTLSGRVHCFECTQKDKEYRQKSYWKDPEKDKIRKQKKHDESEQQGICVRCHKRKPIDGLKMCPTCLAKNRKNTEYGQRKTELHREETLIITIYVICVIKRKKWKTEKCVNRVMKKYVRT